MSGKMILATITLSYLLMCSHALATTRNVTIRIQGWNDGSGEILDEYNVPLTDQTGFSVLDALEEACDDNSIAYLESDGYISSIAGQDSSDFDILLYGGWMYRVWQSSDQPTYPDEDVLSLYGAGEHILNDGDKVTWYYALPEYTFYTTISNYGSISDAPSENTSLTVSVTGDVFVDLWTWDLSGFNKLGGATVMVERISDGQIIASANTVSSGLNKGKATITLPDVTADTDCYVYVQAKYYTNGEEADGIQYVKSWQKEITIQNN